MEVLDGVFSEALLDEIAEDLGIEPGVLRNNPFFRVIKGRVLLTYPLKSTGIPEFQREELDETDPGHLEAFTMLDYEGDGVLYQFWVRTDDGVGTLAKYLTLTIDGEEITVMSPDAVEVAPYYLVDLIASTIAPGLKLTSTGLLYLPFKTSLKVVIAMEAPAGGKKLLADLMWGEYK